MINERKKGKNSKLVFWIFFGIIGFVTLIFPFYAPNLRYSASLFFTGVFRDLINTIGTICTTIGIFMLVFGLLSLFCGRSGSGLKMMIMGVFFVIIGTSIMGFNFLMFIEGKEVPPISKGYD